MITGITTIDPITHADDHMTIFSNPPVGGKKMITPIAGSTLMTSL
jgi:hypothetical protein